MSKTEEILINRFRKIEKHYSALKEYHEAIESLGRSKNMFNPDVYQALRVDERALFDAYLKRFSSFQDYLGAKIFPLLAEVSGLPAGKMTEVLLQMEKEEIIDSVDGWIELREIRNALEHEYPDELEQALKDLKTCLDNFSRLKSYYHKAREYAGRFVDGL